MHLLERFPELAEGLDARVRDLLAGVTCYDETTWATKDNAVEPALLLLERGDAREQLKMMLLSQFHHSVRLNRPDSMHEVVSSCLMLKKPKAFIQGQRPFLLYEFQSSKRAKDTNYMVQSFNSSQDRKKILKKLKTFVQMDDKASRFSDRIIQIADEFLLNALFNAPTDSAGEKVYSHLERDRQVEYLNQKRKGRFFIYTNKAKVLVGCEDPFGSFPIRKAILDMSKSYEAGGGAGGPLGIGLRNVMGLAQCMYLAVKPGRYTSIAVAFQASGRLRDIESAGCNLHFSEVVGT
jgi:hypothetical protein